MRYFPRGVHKEPQLDPASRKQRRSTGSKPVDPERALELRQAESREERQQLRSSDSAYTRFLQEETQDPEMEKLLDEVIEAGMAQGKTDEQILAELGAMTGMLRSEDALTNEEVAQREQKLN